ncbi:MAG: PhoH family protein [Deltaproteobacteria bacterium]|nr:PhoH family protein [Deltaproteobacteria bacterium]
MPLRLQTEPRDSMSASAPVRVEFEDNRLVQALVGGQGMHLKLIERRLGVQVAQRGGQLFVGGPPDAVAQAQRLLTELYELLKSGYPLYAEDVEQAIRVLGADPAARLKEIFLDTVFVSSRNRLVTPKGIAQKRYIDAIREKDIVFGIGPAGTGKTYLAMAMAIAALQEKQCKRIVLTRPAVEAGEKLGFLPGDLAEKVNPYLRPLYDALNDMMDFDKAAALVERGTIEVAPLAFMRGRTLNDAFVILDEAQNTTVDQMKMFLTRLGFASKAVVTGDLTQTDLPQGKVSGLSIAQKILSNIDGIRFCTFSDVDVVRHPLVQEVIRAYEAFDAEQKEQSEKRKAEMAAAREARAQVAAQVQAHLQAATSATSPAALPAHAEPDKKK